MHTMAKHDSVRKKSSYRHQPVASGDEFNSVMKHSIYLSIDILGSCLQLMQFGMILTSSVRVHREFTKWDRPKS